jgi:hypothetical protein
MARLRASECDEFALCAARTDSHAAADKCVENAFLEVLPEG